MFRRIVFCAAAIMALSGGLTVEAFAGDVAEKAAALPEGVKTISTDELKKLIAQKSVFVYDSRSADAFAKSHVDGAASLPLESFDASKLPADKAAQLVFYCGGPSCTLAPASAKKALEAGYTNVAVYHDGVKGWTQGAKS